MTNKWTVNGVEAPEGAEFYDKVHPNWYKTAGYRAYFFHENSWMRSSLSASDIENDHSLERKPESSHSRIEIIASNCSNGEHYNDYAFCLSEAINKLKHCADVAPDDKRKDALLEIVDEVEFIKSEGDK